MKKLGKLLLLVVLSISALNAVEFEKVFGLKDQEFAEVSDKKLNKYKVNDNLIVSLQLSKIEELDGYRHYSKNGGNNKGYINGEFITPKLKNWTFIEDIDLAMGYGGRDTILLKFIDESGFDLTSTIKLRNGTVYTGNICSGDKCLEIRRGRYTIRVTFINNKFTFKINDTLLYSSKKRFGKLKKFEQILYSDGDLSDEPFDNLIDITLSEVK